MDRTERLLNLVALFLDASEPVSLDDIRSAFPDEYSGAKDAVLRKFERDKADLLELGLPLVWARADEGAGYVLDREAYYLPEPKLTPEELAVLYAAGSAALGSGVFPARQELAHALRKVGFFANGPLPASHVRLELGEVGDASVLPARLEALWEAIARRKTVTLSYFSPHAQVQTERRVDPYGLALKRGAWTLVGHCHLRHAMRTFHVHRIRSVTVNAAKPKQPDFEVPDGFELDAWAASFPWQHHLHSKLEVTVRVSGPLVALAPQLFGVEARDEQLTVEVTWLEGLVDFVLSLGAEARVVAPEEAVALYQARARRVLEAHAGAAP